MADSTENDGEGAGDDEAVAAQWAAAIGEDADGTNRVLDQSEIDSLLGVSSDGNGPEVDYSGLQAVLNSALVSYERLPMLEVVFDRLVRMMTTSLRNFTSDNVEVNLEDITSSRFGDYLDSIPLPALLTVFKADEWDNFGLMTIDSSMIYSIVDVLLGGRRGSAPMRIEGRPYTTIERNLVERMVHVVLGDLSTAFDPLAPVTFRFERLEANPRFATIARPANATMIAKLRVDMEDRGGKIELVIPYATLEPVRELLLQMFIGEKFGRDPIWESHLSHELWQTEVPILAVLDELELNLGDVMEWREGTRLELNCSPKSKVKLRCGEVPMFDGQMGRKGSNIAVRIANRLVKDRSAA